jgi:hypothetical protein
MTEVFPSIDRDAIGSREDDVDSERHEPRTIRAINPAKGLHRIKRDFQKRFMAEQCEQLVGCLDEAIAATFKAAPVRERRPYLVMRTQVTLNPAGKEARLERALHAQWSKEGCSPVEGCWERLIAFQVNLPNKRDEENRDWGEIDLLGVGVDGLPVVIELKDGESDEPPPRVLVQAAAYALALQKAWPTFRAEWLAVVRPDRPMPTALHPAQILCVAAEAYWTKWQLASRERTALNRLRDALRERGLPSAFVGLTEGESSYTAALRHTTT